MNTVQNETFRADYVHTISNGETYPQMVARLFKVMPTFEASCIHAAVGITGEVAELTLAALKGDEANILEELGDLRFYVQQLFHMFGWSIDSFLMVKQPESEMPAEVHPMDRLVYFAGEVQDLLKKTWVYGKELDMLALYDATLLMLIAYGQFLQVYELTDIEVMDANAHKLVTGPKARYPLGYTDAAAIARADKADEGNSIAVGEIFTHSQGA